HLFLSSSVMNVLYDKNYYKPAPGQLCTIRRLIDQIAKNYVRLLKFGDTLYRCTQLNALLSVALCEAKDPLAYLEQVHQHISRLPTNIGKRSLINEVTRADVDVQPDAFTTKILFIWHLDYKYLR
ncbi:hypothetical protein K435DRAFT_661449, partial [Dendrothele bispora CBS 962.96]